VAWEWVGPVGIAVVGVAGVIGTAASAWLGRRAQIDLARIHAETEARRLDRADRRALYAKILHQTTTLLNVAIEEGT
jgi:hypothetical protein